MILLGHWVRRRIAAVRGTLYNYSFDGEGTTPIGDQGMDAEVAALIAATGPGGTCSLPSGVVTLNHPITLGASFRGKTLDGTDTTALVIGWAIPSANIRPLSRLDPLYSRFPVASRARVKCVDIGALSIPAGSWPDVDGRHSGESHAGTGFPVGVQVGSTPLEFCQYNGSVSTMGTSAWVEATGPNSYTTIAASGITMPASATDVRIIMTDSTDYNPKNWSVSAVNAGDYSFTLGGACDVEIESGKQRFKVLNAPEYLTYEGAMFISFERKKLYYIPPASGGTLTISKTSGDSVIYISDPVNMDDPAVYAAAYDNRITLSNIAFAATAGGHICADNASFIDVSGCTFNGASIYSVRVNSTEGATFDTCTWNANRNRPLVQTEQRSNRAADPTTQLFQTGPFGTRDSGQPILTGLFVKRQPTAVKLDGCRVENGSLLYPACSAMALGLYYTLFGGEQAATDGSIAYQTGVFNSVFKNLSGPAISCSVMDYRITSNLFQSCCLDVTDAGAVMAGRTALSCLTQVTNNTFTGNDKMHNTSLSDNVAGVMLDDGLYGWDVAGNYFTSGDVGVISNGGRYSTIRRNYFEYLATGIRLANMSAATGRIIMNNLLTIGTAAELLGLSPGVVMNAFGSYATARESGTDNISLGLGTLFNNAYTYNQASVRWTRTDATLAEQNFICNSCGTLNTSSLDSSVNAYMQNANYYHIEAGDVLDVTDTTRWIGSGAQAGYTSYDSGDSAAFDPGSVPAPE